MNLDARKPNLIRGAWKALVIPIVAVLYGLFSAELFSQNTAGCTTDSPCSVNFRVQADSFARIYRNGVKFYDQGGGKWGGRSFNVVAIDPADGEFLGPVRNFDIWFQGQAARSGLQEYLDSLEPGTLFIILIADDAGEMTEGLLSALEALGSRKLRDYTFRDAWLMAAIKGDGRAILEVLSDDRWDESSEVLIDIEFPLRFPLAPNSEVPLEEGARSAEFDSRYLTNVISRSNTEARKDPETLEQFDALAFYASSCAVCHGKNLEGAAQGTPLVGGDLIHGNSLAEISKAIGQGIPARGMPAFSHALNSAQIKSLAIFISEKRLGFLPIDTEVKGRLVIPEKVFQGGGHDFHIETVATGLDPFTFSIAPLPDGRILLTEKTRGLRVIKRGGKKSKLMKGTPKVYDDGLKAQYGKQEGLGWMLDVAIHPKYEENGWIYLHYGDRCSECNTLSRESGEAVSMNKLVRGRIKRGRWVDQETIWQADLETYTSISDVTAGGRICFDDAGHVFISIGIKGRTHYWGIQDLSLPYGKIHRMHDDGRVPADNPFVDVPGALKTIWTYGHRSPQGLEFSSQRKQLWGTEHGPRGGDEVNLLRRGKNYGWPLVSKGLNYDGTAVNYGSVLDIEFKLADLEQPVVDWTPSPAVSSFIFYEGTAFPQWQGNLIVGTLKAAELYRIVLEGDEPAQVEVLLKDLARIRDIEEGVDSAIYLLLEHPSGGQVVRLVPGSQIE